MTSGACLVPSSMQLISCGAVGWRRSPSCALSRHVGLRMLKTRSRSLSLDENNCLAMGLGTIRGLPTAASLPGKGMIAVDLDRRWSFKVKRGWILDSTSFEAVAAP